MIWAPYCGSAPLPSELLGRWNLDPVLIAALAIGLGLLLSRGANRAAVLAAFAVLSNDAAYWAMQLTFLGSAVWFWMAVRSASAPAAAANLLVAMVAMGLLGALITFAAAPLYAPHLLTTGAWGFTPLEDQQVAGLIMWAPAAGLYLVAAVLIIGRMIGPDRSVARAI